jgi:uncharacterized protein (TIGR02594 family)
MNDREQARKVQELINELGIAEVRVDGIIGRKTQSALRRSIGVESLSFADNVRALSAAIAQRREVPGWLTVARSLEGLRERPGSEDEPLILDMAKALGVRYQHDSVAWCGLAVGYAFHQDGLRDLPRYLLRARAWATYGRPCEPRIGALLVFWRGRPDGFEGHVGFYEAESSKYFTVLGGNQGDALCKRRIPKHRLLACRWPLGRGLYDQTMQDDSAPVSDLEA